MWLPGYTEWEDKHHFSRTLENERLYLQGMRDGAQLKLHDSLTPSLTYEKSHLLLP